ncbi:MAG: coproporphyrinogen III oxidase [Alphaproteobacteria bacterium]|nr:coproporphyrinogen III oxidase [Alphaproteobacteria bacterium]
MTRPAADGGFGLYVHWPFCASKCPYCDFNSHVAGGIDQDAWAEALCREIRRTAAETQGERLGSIFFGGGTPSTMPPATVAAVIEAAAVAWSTSSEIEITLEANPGSSDAAAFAGFAAAGVNRLSVGVQSLRDPALRALGRRHDAADAVAAVARAQGIFPRVSLDLIYAREDQRVGEWVSELTEAIGLGTGHLSLYQLTIEPGTPFSARRARGGLRGLPDEDLGAELFTVTQEICAAAGLSAYEVSNHARAGEASRHNLVYWRSGRWVGVGPGAHGRLGQAAARVATEAIRAPGKWLAAVSALGSGEACRTPISAEEGAHEYLMMALRLEEGLSLRRLRSLAPTIAAAEQIAPLVADGLLMRDGDRLAATPAGRLVLDAVIVALAGGE